MKAAVGVLVSMTALSLSKVIPRGGIWDGTLCSDQCVRSAAIPRLRPGASPRVRVGAAAQSVLPSSATAPALERRGGRPLQWPHAAAYGSRLRARTGVAGVNDVPLTR